MTSHSGIAGFGQTGTYARRPLRKSSTLGPDTACRMTRTNFRPGTSSWNWPGTRDERPRHERDSASASTSGGNSLSRQPRPALPEELLHTAHRRVSLPRDTEAKAGRIDWRNAPAQERQPTRKRQLEDSADMLDARQRRRPNDAPPVPTAGSARQHSQPSMRNDGPTEAALTLNERHLDREAAGWLIEERLASQHHLDTLAGRLPGHNARVCISMAQDNQLARRNGYGLALAFLDAKVPPELNLSRLDTYLQMVLASQRLAGVNYRDLTAAPTLRRTISTRQGGSRAPLCNDWRIPPTS